MGIFFACCISLPTTRLSVTSGIGMRSSMMTRKPTVGGGAGSSGACGPPSAWRVLRPLLGYWVTAHHDFRRAVRLQKQENIYSFRPAKERVDSLCGVTLRTPR